jgi:hypothetical protein
MSNFGLQLNVGLALDSFNRFVGYLPPSSGDNLVAEIVVPSHTPDHPISFLVSNVTPGVVHILSITSSWGSAPVPTVSFIPTSNTAVVTLALAYGPNVASIQDGLGNQSFFSIAVTNYAVIFLAEATELTNYTWIPIQNMQNAIASPVGYVLANTFIGDVSVYIPTDLEVLNTLANKLLVKNFLWGPGTDNGVTELFAAFSASTPVLFTMVNRGVPDTFLYRNEESFAGTEMHVWLPNREVERWLTFIQYLNNLPQLYTIKQINEGEVYVQVGDTVHLHSFNFDSEFANTVLSGSAINQCFTNLFRLDLSYTNEYFINFCEASYTLDGQTPPLYSPTTDLLGVRNFTDWSLTGRFEQQFDISDNVHGWAYDSNLGVVDGVNTLFNLSQTPAALTSIKVFLDGLLLRNLIDYVAAGSTLQLTYPPQVGQVVDAQYDTIWTGWAHTAPIQNVDGVTKEFTLPIRCPIPEAVYVTLDGRLLTQGADKQYILGDDGITLKFNFIPQDGQWIWCVYPTVDPITSLAPTSVWNQGVLTWGYTSSPSYATGKILNPSVILPGDSVSIEQVIFTATQTAVGAVHNVTTITPGNTLSFVEAGVTLTGVYSPLYETTRLIGEIPYYSVSGNTFTLNGISVLDNTIVYLYSTGTLPGGIFPYTRYYIINVTLSTFQLSTTFSGSAIPLADQGTGVHFLSTGALPTEFPVGVSMDADANALVTAINNNLGSTYYAAYQGNGLTSIRAIHLTGTASNQTLLVGPSLSQPFYPIDVDTINNKIQILNNGLIDNTSVYLTTTGVLPSGLIPNFNYYAVNVTTNTFQLSLTFNGAAIPLTNGGIGVHTIAASTPPITTTDIVGDSFATLNEIQTILFPQTPTSGKWNLTFHGGVTPDIPYNASSSALATILNTLPTLVTVAVTSIVGGFSIEFADINGSQTQSLLAIYDQPQTFLPASVVGNAITIPLHGFAHGDTVGFFTTGALPAGLTVGATYYVVYIDVNTIELMTAPPNNIVVPLVDQGTGVHTVTRNTLANGSTQVVPTITEVVQGYGGRFPSDVSQLNDSKALAAAINSNLIVNKLYTANPSTGVVALTSISPGSGGESSLVFSGSSMSSVNGISGGSDADVLPFLTPKPFYYADAPVVALDGISTTKYNGYSGNSVVFDAPAESVQAPYIVSQVFPLDLHPLDSMVANQPCSYPKGVFTQGLGSFLTYTEIDYTETATLVITVQGQPYQEAPSGNIDGSNTVFNMLLKSCNGQNSMLLWIDGIFQPTTLYTYSELAGHGVITLSFAPQPNQIIWVWYIIASDSCAEEYVVQLTGLVDGVNTNFNVPNSPWVDTPTLLVFKKGLLSLQGVDYNVDPGNTSITYVTPPTVGDNLWAHFNQGNIGTDKWLQLVVGVGDGAKILWFFPTLLTSELPRSKDSVILALDGFVQRGKGIDYTVNTDHLGNPNGFVTFVEAPGIGVNIQVAFFTRG